MLKVISVLRTEIDFSMKFTPAQKEKYEFEKMLKRS